VRRRSLPAPTPTAGIDWPRLPLPYVANVCFRCFSRFKGMLQLFLMDVTKVDWGCCTCCKCFRGMLQAFVQNVSSVPDVCCKRFDPDVCICFTHMLQQHVPYVSSVLEYVASVLSRCFIYYNDHVASVCSKCFICFSRMLQLFHLSATKVDISVGVFSKEERASAGVMAASAVSWRQRSTEGRAGVRAGAHTPVGVMIPGCLKTSTNRQVG
jgi:hypothetical protein